VLSSTGILTLVVLVGISGDTILILQCPATRYGVMVSLVSLVDLVCLVCLVMLARQMELNTVPVFQLNLWKMFEIINVSTYQNQPVHFGYRRNLSIDKWASYTFGR